MKQVNRWHLIHVVADFPFPKDSIGVRYGFHKDTQSKCPLANKYGNGPMGWVPSWLQNAGQGFPERLRRVPAVMHHYDGPRAYTTPVSGRELVIFPDISWWNTAVLWRGLYTVAKIWGALGIQLTSSDQQSTTSKRDCLIAEAQSRKNVVADHEVISNEQSRTPRQETCKGRDTPAISVPLLFPWNKPNLDPFSGYQFPDISQLQLKTPEVKAVHKTRNRSNIMPEFTSALPNKKSPWTEKFPYIIET